MSKKRKTEIKRVSWLNLHLHIPQKDVRKIIYAMLNNGDRIVVDCAHNGGKNMSLQQTVTLSDHCAKYGYIELFEWGISKGCYVHAHTGTIAAIHGQLEVLKWLKCFDAIPVTANAAENGHLHILKWLHETKRLAGIGICSYATRNGHLDVIQWAANHCRGVGDYDMQYVAAKYGHLHVLKWIKDHGIIINVYECLREAVRYGHYETFLWLIAMNNYVDLQIFHSAAKGGNIDILKCLHNLGCECNKWTAAFAAYGGHLSALQWLIENGCLWDDFVEIYARQKGHDEILKWFEEFKQSTPVN